MLITLLDAIIVVRVAGGNVRHALRDILILDSVVALEEIAIVHHTDCGTSHFTNESLREQIKGRVDKAAWPEVDSIDFGANIEWVPSSGQFYFVGWTTKIITAWSKAFETKLNGSKLTP